jgi:hypothetical protein
MTGSSAERVYFQVVSKGHLMAKWEPGSDALVYTWIQHPRARQELILPIAAIKEAVPHIEPAFAHYLRQWRRCAGPDFGETDWRTVYFEPEEVPPRIADWSKAAVLAEIATRGYPAWWLETFTRDGQARALWEFTGPPQTIYGGAEDDPELTLANIEAGGETPWDLAVPAWDHGFERWVG